MNHATSHDVQTAPRMLNVLLWSLLQQRGLSQSAAGDGAAAVREVRAAVDSGANADVRTAGQALGSPGQVVVLANMCSQTFGSFTFPNWPWVGSALAEVGAAATSAPASSAQGGLTVDLAAFQVRVFTT